MAPGHWLCNLIHLQVTVIEEAIKYIDELHQALAERLHWNPPSGENDVISDIFISGDIDSVRWL